MRSRLPIISLYLALIISAASTLGLLVSATPWCHADPPLTQRNPGVRVMHVGNSHSHALRFLESLAAAAGHAGHKDGEVNILGAPLRWNWDHPEQNKWPQTLAADKPWDAITLLAWAGDDETYAPRFAAEALKGNPKCQVLIYTISPDTHMDWENPSPIRTEAHTEKVAAAVEKAFPNAPKPRVIPTSILIRDLGRLADTGQLPGVANRFELFSDGGHLSKLGMYAIDVMVCAMLYNESPLDYPALYGRKDNKGKLIDGWYDSITIPEPLARIVRQVAWDILLTYPPAGLSKDLVIADRHLPVAVVGQACKIELKALNAAGPCTWSITKGELPAGISLSAQGVVSGQSTSAGDYAVTVKVADGKTTAQRPLTLRISPDKPPVIASLALRPVGLDEYVFEPIKLEGGVGTIKWHLADGKLPFGISLTPAGILVGSPGESGEFRFTLRATDSHPAGGRAATKAITWTIGEASPQTLLVKPVQTLAAKNTEAARIDGLLDEPFWNLDQSISKKVIGAPTKKATFGAVWLDSGKGKGQALYVAIKVVDGPAGKTPRDAIHVYLDGRHNREIVYNADDLHVFVPRAAGAKPQFVRSHTPWWFMKSAVAETPDGYIVEMMIGSAYFLGKGIPIPFGAKGVYGFDLAVDEGDAQLGRQTWRGSDKDDEDTSAFGTIVLTPAR